MSGDSGTVPPARGWHLRAVLQAVGWAGLGVLAIVAALKDFLARFPVNAQGIGPVLRAPSPGLPFGADLLGRDILSETLYALSVTLSSGLLAMLVTLIAGGMAGFVAARSPRTLGAVLRWIAGVPASVPSLLLAMLIIGLAGRDLAALAAGLAAAPFAFVRAFDRARQEEHSAPANYARATGISPTTLLRRDLTYEFRDNFLSGGARALAAVTILLSTASFFGFGAVPPHRDLGLMVAAATPTYFSAWWTAAFPALALMLIILFARLAAGLDEGEPP